MKHLSYIEDARCLKVNDAGIVTLLASSELVRGDLMPYRKGGGNRIFIL